MICKVIFINILDEYKTAEEELFSTHKCNPKKYKYNTSEKIQIYIFKISILSSKGPREKGWV